MPEEGGGASKTTGPAFGSSSGTDVSLREYLMATISERDRRYTEVAAERDRRLTEVATEREKALKIKEEADKAALALAREIQTYKDEKANELREQINNERGLYASKEDLINLGKELTATIKPLADYIARDAGKTVGLGLSINALVAILTLVIAAVAAIAYIATH